VAPARPTGHRTRRSISRLLCLRPKALWLHRLLAGTSEGSAGAFGCVRESSWLGWLAKLACELGTGSDAELVVGVREVALDCADGYV